MTLEIRKLSKTFASDDGRVVRALDDLSFDTESGELIVLFGPNGSGKSTLFRVLSGQISADSGNVVFNGHPLTRRRSNRSGGSIAHVPQEPKTLAFPEMTLEEHLLWAEMSGRSSRFWARGITQLRSVRYRRLLEQYRLDPLIAALAHPLRSLSVGWQQIFVIFKTAVGGNLAERDGRAPDLLLLDEPTSALDAENARLCLDLVKTLHHEGRTVLIATHDAELAIEMAERLCVLRKGRLAANLSGAEIKGLGVAGLLSLASGTKLNGNRVSPPAVL